jgi:hypothetical protein
VAQRVDLRGVAALPAQPLLYVQRKTLRELLGA